MTAPFERDFPGEVLTGEADLLAYAYDASLERHRPHGVAVVRSVDDVRRIVRWCVERGVPYVARGAGTNLSGGCVPLRGGLVLSLAKLDRIIAVDTRDGFAIVEPGVVNLRLQRELSKLGRFYAPDPASHKVCTLGGNVAENAGGPRCLKYGVTTNHVRMIEAVMPDGSLARFSREDGGPEIMSLLIGSEGTLGVAVRIWLDILPVPESIATLLVCFSDLGSAMSCVSDIIASGIVPRALEAMDRTTLKTIEAHAATGYPDAEALLHIEVEGGRFQVQRDIDRIKEAAGKRGAGEFRVAVEEAERERLWEGRRSAYAALSRLSPNVLVEDGVVPRDKLPEAAERIRAIAEEHELKPALLFHAGDGNVHPNVVFDERDAEQASRVRKGGLEMLKACVELGGTISGEHGIGVDKRAAMSWLFEPETLELFGSIKRAFDPSGLANPDKIFPLPGEAMTEGLARRVRPLTDGAKSLVDRVREKARGSEELVVIGSGTRSPKDLRSAVVTPGAEGSREVLTTRPLSSILDFDRANYTLTVETGISPCELKAQLEGKGYYVPVPLVPGTLGGLLAARPWPGMRDHVLGMRLLLADGRVVELGGKTMKNVAGYDLSRLMLGSWGTLAVILDVTLRLHSSRPDVPNDLPAPDKPAPSRWYRALKGAFDPDSRLNMWILDG